MIVAISPFSDTEKSGHSLLDDAFYFEFLLNHKEPFCFYAPPLSAKLLYERFPNAKRHIQVVDPYKPSGWGHFRFARQLKVKAGSKVIFFGYLERLVLVWYLLNIALPFSLSLVATNNIGTGRVEAYRAQMKLFIRAISGKLRRMVVHTEHEKRLLVSLKDGMGEITYVKKHHLMAPINRSRVEPRVGKIVISFFGPLKVDKPIEPFLQLIAADSSDRFQYIIHNQSEKDILSRMSLAQLPDKVLVVEGWSNYATHLENCVASDLIFMTHNHAFEGKLSGNLCDCVALGIPYICVSMEPMNSLHKKYGELGYFCNFDKPTWPEQLLSLINCEDLFAKRSALKRMASDYSIEHIKDDLEAALFP